MLWNLERLKASTKRFKYADLDIRDRRAIEELFQAQRFDLIVHCAAQPSHDKARDIPLLDFDVNTLGTVYLLEATRQHCSDAVFIFFSTNKVYGDLAPSIGISLGESGGVIPVQQNGKTRQRRPTPKYRAVARYLGRESAMEKPQLKLK